MMGITAPEPENERKILLLWISAFLILLLIGVLFTFFVMRHVLRVGEDLKFKI
jgi:hypothetical protein